MQQKRKNSLIIDTLAIMACLLLIQAPGAAYCDDTVSPGAEATAYTYSAEGKKDPFNPFIDLHKKEKEKKAAAAKAAAVKTVSSGTKAAEKEKPEFVPPLQRYAIEEFKLVAVGGSSTKKVAIVRDSAGKSYTLFHDTKIGINDGTVTEIGNNKVTVTEKIRDAEGKIVIRPVVLTFMKEKVEGRK